MADEIKKDDLVADEGNSDETTDKAKESLTTDESLTDAKEKIDRARAEADAHKVIRTREAKERAKDEERQDAERERRKAEQEKQARDITEARIAAMEYAETYRQRLREQKAGSVSKAKQRELERIEEQRARAKADEEREILESIEREREAARERRERAESLLRRLGEDLAVVPTAAEQEAKDSSADAVALTEELPRTPDLAAEPIAAYTPAHSDAFDSADEDSEDTDEPVDGRISIEGGEVAHILTFDVPSIDISGFKRETVGAVAIGVPKSDDSKPSVLTEVEAADAVSETAEAEESKELPEADEAPADAAPADTAPEAADEKEDKKALKKQKKEEKKLKKTEKAEKAAEKKAEKKRRSIEADYELLATMSDFDEKNAATKKKSEPEKKSVDDAGYIPREELSGEGYADAASMPVYPFIPKTEDTPKAGLYPTHDEAVLTPAERARLEREEMTALLRKEGARVDKKPARGGKSEDYDLALSARLADVDSAKAKDRELERFAASELDATGKSRGNAEKRVLDKEMAKEMSRFASSDVDSVKKPAASKPAPKTEKPASASFDKKEVARIVAIQKKTSLKALDSRYEYEITKMEQELERIVGAYALKDKKTKKRLCYLEASIKRLKTERKKAAGAIKADDERYYYTVLRDMRVEKLARKADRYQVLKLREELIGLLNRRDALNLRLSEYYLGKEKGEKHGSDADTRKAYEKGARKERKRYKSLVKKLDAQKILLSQKQKIKALIDEQIDFGGSIAEMTYVLKKRKPQGELRRECVSKLKDAKKKYAANKKRIERESIRAFKDGKKARGSRNAMIIGWVSIIAIAAIVVAYFVFKDQILGFLSTLIPGLG